MKSMLDRMPHRIAVICAVLLSGCGFHEGTYFVPSGEGTVRNMRFVPEYLHHSIGIDLNTTVFARESEADIIVRVILQVGKDATFKFQGSTARLECGSGAPRTIALPKWSGNRILNGQGSLVLFSPDETLLGKTFVKEVPRQGTQLTGQYFMDFSVAPCAAAEFYVQLPPYVLNDSPPVPFNVRFTRKHGLIREPAGI